MVTEREVEAAAKAIRTRRLAEADHDFNADARVALEAAAAARSEPEIPVTEEMLEAGQIASFKERTCYSALTASYRAMRKLEPAPNG